MSTLGELKSNILSVISKMKENLVSKGVQVSDADTLHTLADKVNDIQGQPANPNIYTVDLSVYNYTEEELAEAKAILDYNIVGIWQSEEAQKILGMPESSYGFSSITDMIRNNGFVRPILVPGITLRNGAVNLQSPTGVALSTAIYRGAMNYEGLGTDDKRARNFSAACRSNYGITRLPGGNWKETCGIADMMFENCTSLIDVDLELPNCTSCASIMGGCSELKKARLVIPKVESSRQFFRSCTSLEDAYIDMPLNDRFDYSLERCTGLKKLTIIFGENIESYNNCFSWEFPGNYTLLKNICMHPSATVLNLSTISKWGTDTPENRQSLVDTLITYSYDRASAGYSAAAVSLHADVKALLTEEELTQITNKGYTIA